MTSQLPTLVAARAEEIVGFATIRFEDHECELLTIEATQRRSGIGSRSDLTAAERRNPTTVGYRMRWFEAPC